MRHWIAVEAENGTPDAGGGMSDPWADPTLLFEDWAAVEPLTGSETLRAMQLQHAITHRIVLRHHAGVTTAHRVRLDARVFNVRAVRDPDERQRWLELMAEEGVAL